MTSEGYYDGPIDFVFDEKLKKSTKKWQKEHTDWITKKPLAVDCVVGPACWRRAMHMKGSQNGSKISFLLREKFPGETGTTCRFSQNLEKARGMYKKTVDNSNGPANGAGNDLYCKAMGLPDPKGAIKVYMLKDMCGGL